jgi:bacillolysin
VLVPTLANGTWTTETGLPWVNGATKTRAGTSNTVFGGYSRGYGSSQVDLTSLTGQTVRLVFRVEGDKSGSFYGWWVDDIQLYACQGAPDPAAPSIPTAASVASGVTSAGVSWQPPADPGTTPIASYRITRSSGKVSTVPASARSLSLTGLAANTAVNVSVAAVNQEGLVGVARTVPIYGTTTTVTPSTIRPVKGKAFTITAKVTRRGTSSLVTAMPVTLQRHVRGETVWRPVSTGTTSYKGTRSWSVKQSQVTYYRVVSTGVANWLGTTSAIRTLNVR